MSVLYHYGDIIMGTMASQTTSLAIVYLTVYSGADQIKHQSFASLAFVRRIHRGPVNSPHKWPVTRKMFPFDDVIMSIHLGPNMSMCRLKMYPDSKVHGANKGPTWVLTAPDGPHEPCYQAYQGTTVYRELVSIHISEASTLKTDGARDVIQLASLDLRIPQQEPSLSSKLIPGKMSSGITAN